MIRAASWNGEFRIGVAIIVAGWGKLRKWLGLDSAYTGATCCATTGDLGVFCVDSWRGGEYKRGDLCSGELRDCLAG